MRRRCASTCAANSPCARRRGRRSPPQPGRMPPWRRCARYGGRAMYVDVHSHVVPSGDDGAATIDEGLALCREAADHGTSVLYGTPHVWPLDGLAPEREL